MKLCMKVDIYHGTTRYILKYFVTLAHNNQTLRASDAFLYSLLNFYAPRLGEGALSDDARLTSVCRVHRA